ncbi:MAG: glycosyltransferase [Alphaproteobacteria bacterium]|nr:glycosyltransferase [Alphaproteobacteria bacterium]
MKILQVMAGAARGGAETAFVDMCLALREASQTLEVVTRANDLRVPQLEQAGIPVHALPFGGTADLYTSWKLSRLIRQFRPEIVQTWMSRGSWKTPRWKPSMNIPRYLAVARLGGYYKLKYFRNADYFTTITPDIKRHLVELGVEEGRVRHINNFAETEDVTAPVRRADFGTPEDAPLLLGLGRLHRVKGFDTLIRVVAALPGVHLWIAGEGPERAALEALIQSLDVGGRVRLLGWRSDRAALLQACDICVFSSRYEPFGTVFVQAWAQGAPLITTDSDGPRQFVRDGEDGLMVPVDDATAMGQAVQRLIGDAGLRKKLVEKGHARYRTEFTKERAVQGYLDWYREIRAREGLEI